MNLKTKLIDIYDAIGLPGFLISCNIEPTNRCQLDCVTCYRKGREAGDMAWATFLEAANQIYDIPNISGISLSFAGEPLLHPRFMDMVDHFTEKKNARGKPYNVGFSTNGLLPFDEIIDKVDAINISLDGIGEVHERHRQGSSWEVVNANILDALSLERHRTRIGVNLVPTDQSPDEISAFRAYWKGKADYVGVGSYHTKSMVLRNLGDQTARSWGVCRQIRHTAAILWSGHVTTCCGDLQGLNICGNIHDTPLKNINRRPGPLCEYCSAWRVN